MSTVHGRRVAPHEAEGRVARRIAIGLVVFLLLLGLGALWLYQDVLGPAKTRIAVSTAPPRPEPERRKAAREVLQRLQQQVEQSQQQPAAPPAPAPTDTSQATLPPKDPAQFAVTLSEKDANELVTSLPDVHQALEQANVSDLQLRFEPDRLIAAARVPVVNGMKARITATGNIFAQEGVLGYEAESVKIGSFPAPNAVRDELNKQLGKSIKEMTKHFKGRIETVQLRDQALEVRGTLP